jgi:hypothetical protein
VRRNAALSPASANACYQTGFDCSPDRQSVVAQRRSLRARRQLLDCVRILIAENIGRYSTAGETPVYPATTLKKFQRVRMTYLVTDADIDRVKKKMRGEMFWYESCALRHQGTALCPLLRDSRSVPLEDRIGAMKMS